MRRRISFGRTRTWLLSVANFQLRRNFFFSLCIALFTDEDNRDNTHVNHPLIEPWSPPPPRPAMETRAAAKKQSKQSSTEVLPLAASARISTSTSRKSDVGVERSETAVWWLLKIHKHVFNRLTLRFVVRECVGWCHCQLSTMHCAYIRDPKLGGGTPSRLHFGRVIICSHQTYVPPRSRSSGSQADSVIHPVYTNTLLAAYGIHVQGADRFALTLSHCTSKD